MLRANCTILTLKTLYHQKTGNLLYIPTEIVTFLKFVQKKAFLAKGLFYEKNMIFPKSGKGGQFTVESVNVEIL